MQDEKNDECGMMSDELRAERPSSFIIPHSSLIIPSYPVHPVHPR
jgi:hypothetical protein